MLVTVTLDGSIATVDVPLVQGTPVAQFGRIDYADAATPADAAHRGYGVYVLQYEGAKTTAYVSSLRAADPSARIFLYKALIARPSDAGGWTTFLPWDLTDATGNGGLPTSYFLHDASGTKVFSTAFGGMYFMDFGSAAYRQAALARAIAECQASGFDGLYLDGVDTVLGLGALKPQPGGSQTCATNLDYLAALDGFLVDMGQQCSSNGLLSMGNIGGAAQSDAQAGLWRQWTGVMDGSMDEFWGYDFNKSPLSPAQVQRQLSNAAWSDSNGKLTLLNMNITTRLENVYGLALMMMVSSGSTCWNVSDGQYSGVEVWFPEYDVARSLGAALAASTMRATGLLVREFEGGRVLANPTSQTLSAVIGGKNYVLAPRNALIGG